LGFYGSRPCDSLGRLTNYETLYLVKIGVIEGPLNAATEPLAFESFLEAVCQDDTSRRARYKTYELLRDGGWVVRSGLNYGTDFVLYRNSPDTEHAEYAVVAIDGSAGTDPDMTWRRLLGINRSCVGAKKVGILESEGPV
jgi:tRNA-intron lyase